MERRKVERKDAWGDTERVKTLRSIGSAVCDKGTRHVTKRRFTEGNKIKNKKLGKIRGMSLR